MTTNELVAKACGFTQGHWSGCTNEWREGRESFRPDTDPAAALFALEAYCDKCSFMVTIKRDLSGEYDCYIGSSLEYRHHKGALCTAICAAILAAEESGKPRCETCPSIGCRDGQIFVDDCNADADGIMQGRWVTCGTCHGSGKAGG